jgi:hypothetical protein
MQCCPCIRCTNAEEESRKAPTNADTQDDKNKTLKQGGDYLCFRANGDVEHEDCALSLGLLSVTECGD